MHLRLAMNEAQHIGRLQHVTMLKGWKPLLYIIAMVPRVDLK